MTLQACHTCIWGVSPILLCRSSQALSGWMRALLHSYFQVSPEMFDRVQVRALSGPLKDVPKPLLHCLDCVLRVFVLLEGEPSPPFAVNSLSTVGPFIDRCVSFQIMSNQLNLSHVDPNLSCRNISRMINENRMELSSISSLIEKGLNTYAF